VPAIRTKKRHKSGHLARPTGVRCAHAIHIRIPSRSMHEVPAGWRLASGDPEMILADLRPDYSGDLEIGC
jgi:hypothetical protein